MQGNPSSVQYPEYLDSDQLRLMKQEIAKLKQKHHKQEQEILYLRQLHKRLERELNALKHHFINFERRVRF